MTATPDPRTTPETAEEAGAHLAWISAWLDDSYQPVEAKSAAEWRAEALLWRRTTKGAEEAGEVQGALRGLLAENPRKGQTHTAEDVVGELLDTAVSALGAVEHLTGNVGRSLPLLFEKVAKIRARAGTAVPAASTAVTECQECGQPSPYHRGTCSHRAQVFAATAVTGQDERARISVPRPKINHDGGRPIEDDLREAAQRVEDMRVWGSNKTATVAKLLRDAADACAAPSPAVTAAEARSLTVMQAHEAKDCPDRDRCWAADIHDEHSPRVPAEED